MNEYEAKKEAMAAITEATWKAKAEGAEREARILRDQLNFQKGRNEALEKVFGIFAEMFLKACGGE